MAKEKIIKTMEPGSVVTIPCVGQCGASMKLVPSDETVLPQKGEFTCQKCGGVGSKWKNQAEPADNVSARPPGQATIVPEDDGKKGGRKR